MQLSKEERLELNLLALEENAKLLQYARRLLKKYMEPEIMDEGIWVAANIIIDQKNHKEQMLLRLRQLILNER